MIEIPLIYDGARPPIPSVEPLRSPARPALQVASALDRVRRAPSILAAMRILPDALRVTDTTLLTGVGADAVLMPILEAIDDDSDTVTALTAVHLLARVPGADAEAEFEELLVAGSPAFEEHAAWALSGRAPSVSLIPSLAAAVARGGLTGMHAQTALTSWSATHAPAIVAAVGTALQRTVSADARRYLVETLGLIPGHTAAAALERIVGDDAQPVPVRIAAIAAFGDRTAEDLPNSLRRLSGAGGPLAAAVHGARAHRRLLRHGPRRDRDRSGGLRVAQIHLGEAGGLATLLPQLGDALAGQQRVAESTTVVRAAVRDHLSTSRARSSRLDAIELAPGEGSDFSGPWPALAAAKRGIRAAFLASTLPDVVHLRMADPGSLAGATVARDLGIPVIFTLAPDPHGPIAAAESTGSLERAGFAAADAASALWFRASLVERLARDARELVLFPRAGSADEIESLTGIDLAAGPPRHTIVPEGIDTARSAEAAESIAAANEVPAVIADLQHSISALPPDRHGLPLVVSVGRLHEVKGMVRIIEAFALDAELAARANLVIVGGDLERPSATEAAELARIRSLLARYPGLEQRVVLLGQRSNQEVRLVLAAVRAGWGPLIDADGAYVCASVKEEFGLAIIEALAAGLPAVGPRTGGPATYIEDETTGVLVDTSDAAAIGSAAVAALDVSKQPETATRARDIVAERFTLERMARTLAAVYRVAAGATSLASPVDEIDVEVAA